MPRNQTQGTTLRNRNRVTNKTRLKILRGNIDADPLILDEEEERARVIATSGVDADDANEHHLQVAINAATQRHSAFAQDIKSRDGDGQREKKETYIPTPDATGLVEGYREYYPLNRWFPPQTHLRFADTLEDTIQFGLSDGYSYYMDERDKEWLEKNNRLANGEGTSAQAIATGGLTARPSRTSKTKGKDPDNCNAILMTEDEFELVMGLFEKVTDERHPFLHVDPSQIPSFAEYEPTFSNPLPIAWFSAFVIPSFASDPVRIATLASVIYNHWRSRRTERNGCRILAQLNADESNENDPYVCFRRRDSKPVRKTRTAQNAISEKMIRLKAELGQSYSMALAVLQREQLKQSQVHNALSLWKMRSRALDLKRKIGWQMTKEEEELLVDKERPSKKQKTVEAAKSNAMLKAPQRESPLQATEPRPSPKERYQKIQSDVLDEIAKYRDKCSSWEDVVDLSCHCNAAMLSSRTFSRIPLSESDFSESCSKTPAIRTVRLRFSRARRLVLDRYSQRTRESLLDFASYDSKSAHFGEGAKRQEERWRYDDEYPMLEQSMDDGDRFILDDFDAKRLVASSILLTEEDRMALSTDHQSFHPGMGHEILRNQRILQQRRQYIDSQSPRFVAGTQSNQPSHSPLVPLSNVSGAFPASTSPDQSRDTLGKGTSYTNGAGVNCGSASSAGSFLTLRSPLQAQGDSNSQFGGYESRLLDNQTLIKSSQPSPPTVLIPSVEHSAMFQAPSIARHKLQGAQPYLPTQQQTPISNSPTQMGHLNGEQSGQRALKQQLNGPQKLHNHNNVQLTYSMSPPHAPLYPAANLGYIQGNTESLNLTMGPHINLKLPSRRNHDRVSPQLQGPGNDSSCAASLSPSTSSTSLGSRSPMVRSTSTGNNQASPSYCGSSSPLNSAYANGINQSHVSPPLRSHGAHQQRSSGSPAAQVKSLATSFPTAVPTKQFTNQNQRELF